MSETSQAIADWVTKAYEPAVACIAGVFRESGCTAERADHNARACLARLTRLDPPIVVELLRDDPLNEEDTS